MSGMLRKGLLLDRDGIVNVDHGYVCRVDDWQFVPGIFDLVRAARARGHAVAIVTNQAGIGRGYYTEQDFHRLTDWMLGEFASAGAPVDRVYFCPYHPEHGQGEYRRESDMRKPGPGMLLLAAQELGLDLSRSTLVGDHESDVLAGVRAGVGRIILVSTDERLHAQTRAHIVVPSIADVAAHLD